MIQEQLNNTVTLFCMLFLLGAGTSLREKTGLKVIENPKDQFAFQGFTKFKRRIFVVVCISEAELGYI